VASTTAVNGFGNNDNDKPDALMPAGFFYERIITKNID